MSVARHLVAKWRESASLIIASRHADKTTKEFDYKILLFKRHDSATFMPNSYVFPGGVQEAADEAPSWLKHFKRFGVTETELNQYAVGANTIFQKRPESIHKAISLRISALRETFEEVGVLLGISRDDAYATYQRHGFHKILAQLSPSDVKQWQDLVHQDPHNFQRLCGELKILPDLWSLNNWSTWLTPSNKKKRFATGFYLATLETTPDIMLETNEAADCMWCTPRQYLQAFKDQKLDLPPPQICEITRLLKHKTLDSLRDFAGGQDNQQRHLTVTLPVQHKCVDGMVGLLPGDDMYPNDPNALGEQRQITSTINEFRREAKRLHRYEFPKNGEATFQMSGSL